MERPQSPHGHSAAALSGGFGIVYPSNDAFRAPVPLRPRASLSSTTRRPSAIMSTLATTFSESAFPREHQISSELMSVTAPAQWPAHSDLSANHMGQDGTGFAMPLEPLQFTPESGVLYDYAQNVPLYNGNYNLTYSAQYPGSSCPRSYAPGLDITGLPSDMSMVEAYPPAAYQIEPAKPHEVMELSDHSVNGQLTQLSEDYESHCANVKLDEHAGYPNTYESDVTRSSTPRDDEPSPPHRFKPGGATDDNVIDKEQPYAQLIYRALQEQPGHTMVLRDIYDWFKKNTDKAADKETKGWQNSIRHNLSMNGAFEKVDQPGEEAKKGFMWRLTEEAIRDGVKSTTRYRSKQPNKRGHRSQHPLPQRQASGAKGGQAARRSAKLRRSTRMNEPYRSEPFVARSVPSRYDAPFDSPEAGFMSYPHSPYYGSDTEYGYSSKQDNFGSPMGGNGLGLFPTPVYTGSAVSHGISGPDTAHVLPHDFSEPLFSNSPTPEADEPRTPDSQGDEWETGMLTGNTPYIFDGTYQEYMG